ncbi:MAG: redox-regulated ATPase YchF [Mycoplasmatales bacterium]|nr:redox-regulated ATPase YchF [Mycoplasmatales bacterium]
MSLKAGIVGLPNVGKSTLFNAITNSQVEAANYPFATIEPNIGVVELPDLRLDVLEKIVLPKRVIHATFEFTDIAGLVEGASKGEGLGNKFLANIREVDAIIQVVRCFEDSDISHVSGSVDPVRDMNLINIELLLSDMETVNNVLKRIERKSQNDKTLIPEVNVARKLREAFEKEIPARNLDYSDEELKIVKGWQLLTLKPILYVGNVAEEYAANPKQSDLYKMMKEEAKNQNVKYLGISAKIEGEISQMEEEDKKLFLDDLGIIQSGLDRLTRVAFELLDLSTYFTAGVEEVRAWTFKNGTKAPKAAGIIHTDFEKGFIKAEVISYNDFIEFNGEHGARDAGKSRLEGKDYVMKDGDIVHFRFNR